MKVLTSKTIVLGAITLSAIGVLVSGLGVFAAPSFTPDDQPIGYVGQPAVTNLKVTGGTERVFSIDYKSQDWSGDLHSFGVSSNGTIIYEDSWVGGARGMINSQDFDAGRIIVTRGASAGVPFRWLSLTSAQKTALDPVTASNSDLTTSPLLNYIRGDRSNQRLADGTSAMDSQNYRYRRYVLGDIVHSTPIYCPADKCGSSTVFVGANDGMLHAINADTGSERFAYIPSMLVPRLPRLTAYPYTHTYYVDGRMDVKKFGSQTVLVGTLAAGGKGLYALDVTNAAPSSESDAATKILWEKTDADLPDLGYTYSAPVLVELPNGTAAMIVGNGYMSSSGKAVLYLINAKTGALIHAFDTQSGNASSPNGLSSPAVWSSRTDGKIDTVFAGDLNGNLWKFSLSDYTIEGSAPLFTTNPVQSITMAPGIMQHPNGGVMVNFVTGRMLASSDKADSSIHYAYGIWDKAPLNNSSLLTQTLSAATYNDGTRDVPVRTATNNQPDWSDGNHKGWRVALLVGGERMVGDGAFTRGAERVFQFMSTNPVVNSNGQPPGENWWMQLNALTGGDNGTIKFDLNRDDSFTSQDQLSGGVNPVGLHMGGGVRSQLIPLEASGGLYVYQASLDKNDMPTTTTETVTAERGVSGGHFDFDFYCNPLVVGINCSDVSNATAGKTYPGTSLSTGSPAPKLDYIHMHEYDDIYDVTGVDMLNPSQRAMKLSRVLATTSTPAETLSSVQNGTEVKSGSDSSKNEPSSNPTVKTEDGNPVAVAGYPMPTTSGATEAITYKVTFNRTKTTTTNKNIKYSWSTKSYSWDIYTKVDTMTVTKTWTVTNLGFKVLVANQAYSPAAKLYIGGSDATRVFDYQTTTGLTAESLTAYSLSNIGSLTLSLPLDAFRARDWGTGIVRAGLHPTDPDCVVARNGNVPKKGPSPNYEWRNGALTIQIVKDTVGTSDIRMNVSGKPEFGYVLKDDSVGSKLIAEYTIFWHADQYSKGRFDDKCMGDSGWNSAPIEDNTSDAIAANPEPNSTDPKAGIFRGSGGGNSGDDSISTITITILKPDGTLVVTTKTTVARADGSSVTTTTTTTTGSNQGVSTGGRQDDEGLNPRGPSTSGLPLGRLRWRELQP